MSIIYILIPRWLRNIAQQCANGGGDDDDGDDDGGGDDDDDGDDDVQGGNCWQLRDNTGAAFAFRWRRNNHNNNDK